MIDDDELPEKFKDCSSAMRIFKFNPGNPFLLPILNQLRADIFYALVKNPEEQVFTTNFGELLDLVIYDYNRDPKVENFSEDDVKATLYMLLNTNAITKLQIDGNIVKYRISDLLAVVGRGEVEVLRLMLDDRFEEITNSSKDLLKVLQFMLLRSCIRKGKFNDTIVRIGEFFAGKTNGSRELGLMPRVFTDLVNELLDLEVISIAEELEINGYPYYKYMLSMRFGQKTNYFTDHFVAQFSWTEVAKEKEIVLRRYLDYALEQLELAGDGETNWDKAASVVEHFDKILPEVFGPDNLHSLQLRDPLESYLIEYPASSVLFAFKKVLAEFSMKKFTDRSVVHDRIKYYVEVCENKKNNNL